MNTVLKKFIGEPLFDACAAMLDHLHISFNEVTRTPVPFDGIYPGPLTKTLLEIMTKVEHTYFIGTVDEASLSGHKSQQDETDVTQQAAEGKYIGMMIFAVNIANGQSLTRTEMATLTRGFNRIAAAQPVILFIKQGDKLALATCERSEYTQQWRDGEKLGKVSMLRGINCLQPHRGHIDILESIGDKAYPNFEELYKHWMQVFSSELLTKKFYGELSDWYAWAVQVARFPNNLETTADDEKFNHESCIRLITRLIFVWFLKQKHLIPKEFFDEDYIREHFIDEFNPHDRRNLLYDPEKSYYYRLILQNLFFAMLNRPIVPEGKDTPNNRRFRGDGQKGFLRSDYNVNNLMRYKSDFKAGGADEFVQLANSHVPFLNGGLFDCLDDKPKNLYYDGFSERKESLEQLYLPDWLFFGKEVGQSIDLSEWYGDAKKKKVSAQGLIDILKKYNFTIEENTPLDQEVSLDPELLGKAFENLLASYNPETKTSARKQTGSFYTPREIVQYMVDESLVAHLKRVCGDELEPQYRSLLNYSTEETTLSKEQRRNIMQAIYNCRVLDPACGSGAFPMGVLQQMVHILRQLDPTNEMWKDFMIDQAIEESRVAFAADEDEERKARLADIEESFDKSINDPDYARKLYLIEHCIFGVDIQPIAVQISKLRFFISLVVDQKPTDNAAHNFGIRPLPNLESKFVAANTLIPADYDASLFESTEDILSKKEILKELNHQIFLAKRNIDKQRLKAQIKETRKALAKAIEETGFVNPGAAQLLADWDMFEQNTKADFFDAEWMFGVKGGFDIVIANPPYFVINSKVPEKDKYEQLYPQLKSGRMNIYQLFLGVSGNILNHNGIAVIIHPKTLLGDAYLSATRRFLLNRFNNISILNIENRRDVFENVLQAVIVSCWTRTATDSYKVSCINTKKELENLHIVELERNQFVNEEGKIVVRSDLRVYDLLQKINSTPYNHLSFVTGKVEWNKYKIYLKSKYHKGSSRLLFGENVQRFSFLQSKRRVNESFIDCPDVETLSLPAILTQRTTASEQEWRIIANLIIPSEFPYTLVTENSTNVYLVSDENQGRFILGVLCSKLIDFYFRAINSNTHVSSTELNSLPIIRTSENNMVNVQNHVVSIICKKKNGEDSTEEEQKLDRLVYHLYGLTYDEVLIIDPTPPFTQEEYEQENI